MPTVSAPIPPLLSGGEVFRTGEQVYVNRSDESWQQYMNVLHRHDFIEIAYIVSGRGIHQVGDRQYRTRAGDLFIINHDVAHGFFPLPEDAEKDSTSSGTSPVVYNCVFLPTFLDASLLDSASFGHVASSWLFRTLFPETGIPEADLHLSGADSREIGALFAQMHGEYREARKGYADIIRALLILIIIKVFRLMDAAPASSASDTHRRLVDQAIAYMKEHFSTELRLEDVAMQSFVSKHHFSRLFREVTGTRFSDYIQQLRIDQAVLLLRTTEKKVVDIAAECGFHDLKNFYVIFRKQLGCTPGDYRKNQA